VRGRASRNGRAFAAAFVGELGTSRGGRCDHLEVEFDLGRAAFGDGAEPGTLSAGYLSVNIRDGCLVRSCVSSSADTGIRACPRSRSSEGDTYLDVVSVGVFIPV
jgi:hypothetical protein